MKNYLLLRLRTQLRQWRELGWWRAALLLFLAAAALRQLWLGLALAPAARWAVPPLVLLSVASAHRRRADLAFLQLAAPSFRRWLAAEYALLAAGAAALPGGHGYWLSALLTVAVAPLCARLPPAAERTQRPRRSVVRSEVFEWVSGLRRRWGAPIWLGLLAVAYWQRHQPTAPGLCLAAWLLVVASFYDVPESVPLLLSSARSAGAWLRGRLGWAALYWTLSAAPFLMLLVLGPAGVGGAGLLWLWSFTVLALVIMAKYTFYPHQATMRYAQSGVVALGFLILMHPVYVALMAAVLVGLTWRSRYRLNGFRYD